MKALKKMISLTMSAILLITTNSALQAAKVDTAQMQEIKELRSDIIKEVKREKLYPNLPRPEEMIFRHGQAVKNEEAQVGKILAEFKAKYPVTKEKEEEAKGFAKELKSALQNTTLSAYGVFSKYQNKYIDEKTLKIIKQVSQKINKEADTARYKKVIKNKGERIKVAANTALYADSFWDLVEDIDFFFEDICQNDQTCVGILIGLRSIVVFVIGTGVVLFSETIKNEILHNVLAYSGGAIILMGFLLMFFSSAYSPSIAPIFDEEKTLQMFTEKPFEYLADFEKKNKEFEYVNIYNKGPKAAQALNDVVDIEYYVSANPDNLENIKDKLYIGTIDWYEMEPEARAEYLHNFAERLRTEAKAKALEYSNTHSFKKGLAEK